MERDNFRLGLVVWGIFLIFLLVAAGLVGANWPSYDHDPVRLLELRSKCLETDHNITSRYCDDYAERYSRIERKR